MWKFLKRGRSVLEHAPEGPKRSANIIVRIYYQCQGDELLAVESDPL